MWNENINIISISIIIYSHAVWVEEKSVKVIDR